MATVIPLYKGRTHADVEDMDSEQKAQLEKELMQKHDLVNEGAVPLDAVTLYMCKLLPGEDVEERDEHMMYQPLLDDQLLYVGPGRTADEIRETTTNLVRLQFKPDRERLDLDFGYYKKFVQKKGWKVSARGLNFNPEARAELMDLMNNRDAALDAIERYVQQQDVNEGVQTRGAQKAAREEAQGMAARTRQRTTTT
jgi:hypothetical protein